MKRNAIHLPRTLLFLGLALFWLVGQHGWATDTGATSAAVEARILDDLKYLAGDTCEGRGTNTKGIQLAADYIANEFKKNGVKPGGKDGSYFQPFKITSKLKVVDEECALRLKGPQGQAFSLELGKQFTVLGFSAAGKAAAPIVFAGYGVTSQDPTYDDFAGIDVAGKIVVVLRFLPRNGNQEANPFLKQTQLADHPRAALVAKASNAEVHKAAAVIFVNDNATAAADDSLRDFRSTSSMDGLGIPVLHVRRSFINSMVRNVAGEDLSEIEKAIDRDLKPHSFALDGWTCDLQAAVQREAVTVKNIVGVVEGSGPLADETIVIGAHYDHLGFGEPGSLAPGSKAIHYGADDNCSGTVSVVELARRFGPLQGQKGRRIVLMTFAGEERGLLGSLHYCKEPLFPLDKTVAMINLDMVGRYRPNEKLSVLGLGSSPEFDPLVDRINQKHQLELKKSASVMLAFGGSDHQSFYQKNIPVIFFFTGLHPQYHKPSDTVDLINVAGIRQIVEMTEDIANELRVSEKRPEFKRTGGGGLSMGGGPRGGPRLGIMPSYTDEKDGLLLEGVTDNGPAAKAGLKTDDRIVDINGKPVKNIQAYMTIMSGFKKGDKIDVTVQRKEETKKLTVLLE